MATCCRFPGKRLSFFTGNCNTHVPRRLLDFWVSFGWETFVVPNKNSGKGDHKEKSAHCLYFFACVLSLLHFTGQGRWFWSGNQILYNAVAPIFLSNAISLLLLYRAVFLGALEIKSLYINGILQECAWKVPCRRRRPIVNDARKRQKKIKQCSASDVILFSAFFLFLWPHYVAISPPINLGECIWCMFAEY